MYVIHDDDLRYFGRPCFKCICFASGDEADRVSGLNANVHTDVLTFDTISSGPYSLATSYVLTMFVLCSLLDLVTIRPAQCCSDYPR